MDSNEGEEVELRVYNCLACMGWWHYTCLTEEDRQSLPTDLIENVEDGVAPPWRCKDCVKATKYAVQRILEVLRDEEGRFYFVLDYLGYRLWEVRLTTLVEDKKAELRLAYKEHALTRTTQSLLYCASAILDAAAQDEPFKDLGLLTKLIHPERTEFLISQATLIKRGLSPAMANVYQTLVDPAHRLVFPFNSELLLRTTTGQTLPTLPPLVERIRRLDGMELDDCTPAVEVGNEAAETQQPTLAGIATHLEALTAPTSLPMALSNALDRSDDVAEGLRWINGSSVTDIYTTLQLFCGEYDERNWNGLLRRLVPGLSDEDCAWLSSLALEDEHLEPTEPEMALPSHMPPPTGPAVKGRRKRKSTLVTAGPNRRSPRLSAPFEQPMDTEMDAAPVEGDAFEDPVGTQLPPPSPLAESQRPFRKQISRAYRKLYGSGSHAGLLFSLGILTLYLQRLGVYNPDTGQDHVIYFRTRDMDHRRKWLEMPADIDCTQPSVACNSDALLRRKNPITDCSSGIGPTHGVEP
jgi:hypothetical protein